MRIIDTESIALVVDLQERLMPAMQGGEELLANCRRFLEGLHILGVPLLASEQYPKGLGATVPVIAEMLGDAPVLAKVSFSCMDDEAIRSRLAASGRKTVLVIGVESHVCVAQTVIDLLAAGYRPVLVADCVSSRKPADRDLAITRLREEGAIVTSSESLLFELCRHAGTDRFKAISRLVK